MDVLQLIRIAHLQTEERYDNDLWKIYINACLDDLTPAAKMLKTSVVPNVPVVNGMATIALSGVTANAELAKMHECLYVHLTPTEEIIAGTPTPITVARPHQVSRLSMADRMSFGWQLTSDEISTINIPQSRNGNTISRATITISYYKKLNHVLSVADVPELPEQYHNLIVLYLCAKSQQKEEEINDKQDFYGEYLLGKANMARDRIWETEPQNRKFIRKARIATITGSATDK